MPEAPQKKFKPKVFIVGISGFLGYNLAQRLKKDFLVVGVYFTHPVFIPDVQTFPINMKNIEALETLLRIHAPDFTINAMGMVDKKFINDNEKLADNINVGIPLSIAVLASKLRSKFIQLSCCDVYEGSNGNYSEESTDYTLNDLFGKQKITVESYIRSQTMESTTLRLGRVMGIGNPYRYNRFDFFRLTLSRGGAINMAKSRINSYLSPTAFLDAIELILKNEIPSKHRIFNLGGANLNEYDFWKGWMDLLEIDKKLLKENAEASKINLSLITKSFPLAYSKWKPETAENVYLNILREMAPGLGAKKSLVKRLEATP